MPALPTNVVDAFLSGDNLLIDAWEKEIEDEESEGLPEPFENEDEYDPDGEETRYYLRGE